MFRALIMILVLVLALAACGPTAQDIAATQAAQ